MRNQNGGARRDASTEGGARADGTTPVRRRAFLATSGAAALALGGCLGNAGTQSEEPTETELPEVTYRHNFRRVSTAVSINDAAEEYGLWKEEGVDVTFETSTGAKKAAKSVAEGTDEFGNGDYATITAMINSGAPLRIIGHHHYPQDGVVALDDWLDGFADLEGKTVGQYDPNSPRLKEAIRMDGGDPSKVEWKTINPGGAEKLLVEDEVDAARAYWAAPLTWLRHNGYEATALNLSDPLQYMGNTFYGHKDVVENQPEVVEGLIRGIMKANRMACNDFDKLAKVYREKTGMSEEDYNRELDYDAIGYHLAARIPDRETALDKGFGWLDKDRLEHTLDLYVELDVLDEAKPIDEYLHLGFFEDNNDLAVDTAQTILDTLEEEYPFGTDVI